MTTIRAKFRVLRIDVQNEGDKLVIAEAVMDGSEENNSFAKYTPSGRLEMTISVDTAASRFFAQWMEFYLDFTDAKVTKEVAA
jgi:hypothetical protein